MNLTVVNGAAVFVVILRTNVRMHAHTHTPLISSAFGTEKNKKGTNAQKYVEKEGKIQMKEFIIAI